MDVGEILASLRRWEPEAFEGVLRQLLKASDCTAGALYVLEPERGVLYPCAVQGMPWVFQRPLRTPEEVEAFWGPGWERTGLQEYSLESIGLEEARRALEETGLQRLYMLWVWEEDLPIGLVQLATSSPEPWEEGKRREVETLAEAVGTVLVPLSWRHRLQQHTAHWEAVTALVAQLAQAETLEETLEQVLAVAMNQLKAERAALFLLDPQTGRLSCPRAVGLSKEYVQFLLLHHHLAPGAMAALRGEIFWSLDASTDPRLEALRPQVVGEGFHSFAVFPLRLPQRTLGALVVYRNQVLPFSPEELRRGQLLSQVMALAMEKMRLLEVQQQWSKELERRVEERTFELKQRHQEAEEFAYALSHELGALLRSIEFHLRNALNLFPSESARGYVEDALQTCGRLQDLLEGMAGLFRWGARGLHREPVPFHTLLADVLRDLRPQILEQQAIVSAEVEPLVLEADRELLYSLLMNLLQNALRFARPGQPPRVWVRARREVSLEGRRWARIEVEDEGVGIAPEEQEHIFRPFYRGRGAQEGPGLGLGLHLVKRVVEWHRGEVFVRSEMERGTCFVVRLPHR